jgi:hypothetical protein
MGNKNRFFILVCFIQNKYNAELEEKQIPAPLTQLGNLRVPAIFGEEEGDRVLLGKKGSEWGLFQPLQPNPDPFKKFILSQNISQIHYTRSLV